MWFFDGTCRGIVFFGRKTPAAASVIYRGHRQMWVSVVVLSGGAKQKRRSAV
jgi:hypothetical protein